MRTDRASVETDTASWAFEFAATTALALACLKEALHWDTISHLDLIAYSFGACFVIHDFTRKWHLLWRRGTGVTALENRPAALR